MKSERSIFFAGVVMSIAVGTGFVMQNGTELALDDLSVQGPVAAVSFAAVAQPAQLPPAASAAQAEAVDPALLPPSLPEDPVHRALVAPPPRGLAMRLEAISGAGDDLGTVVAMQAQLSLSGLR